MEISVLELPTPAGIKLSGILSLVADTTADPLNPDHLNDDPGATLLVQHKGLSMINAFIPPDALLLVDKTVIPQNNSIVLAEVNGTLMVRYLKKNDYRRRLVPANSKYPEIEINARTKFAIHGVVTHVISDPRKLIDVC